ncbi:MAG: hypothetical protein HYZ37_10105 [Candidatus Solibacter usitatus]|nr:hypothetical protein [Candidatus Solibacter usitatus]
MPSLYEIKESEVADTPVVLLEVEEGNGYKHYWSTHEVVQNAHSYQARVLRHDAFDLSGGRVSVTLAHTDSALSRAWKGAQLIARFAFFDLTTGLATSEIRTLFRGICSGVDEIAETTVRLSFHNRISTQRVTLPNVRVQRRCSWLFPERAEQRLVAIDGGTEGRYSPFFACGYSADQAGGVGLLDGSSAYSSCGYTQPDCESRGMFAVGRFGGVDLIPAVSTLPVPIVYGSGWVRGIVARGRTEGNGTHVEVLIGGGPLQGVEKVIVNGYELSERDSSRDQSATGWYRVVSLGERNGVPCMEFGDAGRPYGSVAYLYSYVPNNMQKSGTEPRFDVLVDGLKLPLYAEDGSPMTPGNTSNPAWVLLDVLRRSGWRLAELNAGSFATVAQYCDELIAAEDTQGNAIMVPRFRCHLVLAERKSTSEIIRNITQGSLLFLRYGTDGRLEVSIESTLPGQQSSKPLGSNSTVAMNGGWPAYEFGDGTNGYSGIARRGNGEPSLRFTTKSASDIPNRLSMQVRDELNHYQVDTVSMADVSDVERAGQEIQSGVVIEGVANYNQAARILQCMLRRSIAGNFFAEFDTSVRGITLRPGDIITLTYAKEGIDRKPFRILTLQPSLNCARIHVVAQLHDDGWYTDAAGGRSIVHGGQSSYPLRVPRPLQGNMVDSDGQVQYSISEYAVELADGSAASVVSAGFTTPAKPDIAQSRRPSLSLSAETNATGGTLAGNRTLYYGITGVGAGGAESELSFVAKATLGAGTTYQVTLRDILLPVEATTFSVYRGGDPSEMRRIAAGATGASFIDTGITPDFIVPPDANYHHANLYWREELQPPAAATLYSANTIGNGSLAMAAGTLSGKIARITKGVGAGQERRIESNTATGLTVTPTWQVTPDSSSWFCVAESSWKLGASGASSPVSFEVPNRPGLTVHVSGRGANAQDMESPAEASPATRWFIGGAAGSSLDSGPPPMPSFGLSVGAAGAVEVAGISFSSFANTRSIETGTVTLHHWNELMNPTAFTITSAAGAAETTIALSTAGTALVGNHVQVGAEIMKVVEVLSAGFSYRVDRGVLGTSAAGHASGEKMYHLTARTTILAFPRDFFGSPASGMYSASISLPDVRVAAVELSVTNSKGTSPVRSQAFTGLSAGGLRTLSGGQYTMQVEGFLAVQNKATPDLVCDASHAVRDIFARVQEAPVTSSIQMTVRLNGADYCSLSIPAGALVSNTILGTDLPPLQAQSILTLAITSVPTGATDTPGRDLTVTIRL